MIRTKNTQIEFFFSQMMKILAEVIEVRLLYVDKRQEICLKLVSILIFSLCQNLIRSKFDLISKYFSQISFHLMRKKFQS